MNRNEMLIWPWAYMSPLCRAFCQAWVRIPSSIDFPFFSARLLFL